MSQERFYTYYKKPFRSLNESLSSIILIVARFKGFPSFERALPYASYKKTL
jgi:hypothetical protein